MAQLSSLLPSFLADYVGTTAKAINNLLIVMAVVNVLLLTSCLQATMLPNLGISPSMVSTLLIFQNGLVWIALNQRSSHTSTIITSDFLVGIVLGISIGGGFMALMLSQFFGRLTHCVELKFDNSDYKCEHQSQMNGIWFCSGLMFWLEALLVVLILVGKDELLYTSQNYESIGIALEELENNFQQNAVFNSSRVGNLITQASDGTFFGSASSIGIARTGHTEIGEATFPTTPSQEAAAATAASRPGQQSAYGSSYHQHHHGETATSAQSPDDDAVVVHV